MSEYAPYASFPNASRGRLHAEPECSMRGAFQRDRDRIIHSAAFRRLEYKTQVFVNHEGDHYRTRLTHSLEVSQLTRSMCRLLHLNEDLGEALALAHDLGHTPFGHAGEDALDAVMAPYGGFDHNAQTIRILTLLEARYADFDGLNLSWETLEGIAKHNGPVDSLPRALAEYQQQQDLELGTYASLEAQVAALGDDIAYNNHDIEDGLRAGFFTLEELLDLPLLGEIVAGVLKDHAGLEKRRQTHEVVRRMISRMVSDVLGEVKRRLAEQKVHSVEEIRALNHPIAEFTEEMRDANRQIKAFLMQHMYRHYRVNRMTSKAHRVVKELFTHLLQESDCLPPRWRDAAEGKDEQVRAVIVCDFVAGMTDRFALEEHARLFDPLFRY